MRRGRDKKLNLRNPVIMSTTPREPAAAVYVPKWFFGLVAVVLLVGGFYYLFLMSPYFNIQDVIIDGTLSPQGQQILNSYKQTNIFRADSGVIEARIIEVNPEISSIKIYRGIPNTLKAVVIQRENVLIWQSGSKYYIVDKAGVAFKEVNDVSVVPYNSLSKVLDKQSVPVEVGSQVVTLRLINFIKIFGDGFKDKIGVNLVSWEIGETSIDAVAVTDLGWRVITDTTRSPEYQLSDLATIVKAHKADIHQYVDLRVVGYGYYQ